MFSAAHFGAMKKGTSLEVGRRGLDELLGGGIPCGRLVEVSGTSSSGKATLALGLCLRALEQGRAAAWIDVEGGFWPVAAVEAGLPLDRFLVVKLPSGAAALRAAHILLSSTGAVAALVVDLPAAAPRERELVALQRMAERSDAALLFLTARARDAPSLGATVALRLHAERRPGGRLAVEVLRNKGGHSQRTIEEVMDGPDRVRAGRAL
jgi:RecA/RadA recombinase